MRLTDNTCTGKVSLVAAGEAGGGGRGDKQDV